MMVDKNQNPVQTGLGNQNDDSGGDKGKPSFDKIVEMYKDDIDKIINQKLVGQGKALKEMQEKLSQTEQQRQAEIDAAMAEQKKKWLEEGKKDELINMLSKETETHKSSLSQTMKENETLKEQLLRYREADKKDLEELIKKLPKDARLLIAESADIREQKRIAMQVYSMLQSSDSNTGSLNFSFANPPGGTKQTPEQIKEQRDNTMRDLMLGKVKDNNGKGGAK